jgi:GT2 family glycosyltransferase
MTSISAVVVTHNRKQLLGECLEALSNQTLPVNRIFVVDNASTDGTADWLSQWITSHDSNVELIALDSNLGGAGGFSEGLRRSVSEGYEWTWMMDDDAHPFPTALEEINSVASDTNNVYGSLAVCGDAASWPLTLADGSRTISFAGGAPSHAAVESIPMLGFFIHRSLVSKIGYPDSDFFIAADDIEYCLRARRSGSSIILAGRSRISHPQAKRTVVKLFWKKMSYLSLSPMKRYYDTRNRILIAREYYGIRLFTHAIPGTIVRFVIALWREPGKLAQVRAFAAGILDGILGRKGIRHVKWGIPQ